MLQIARSRSFLSVVSRPSCAFSGNPFKKRKQTSKDLEKYDVVIVGANLGGILSNHIDAETHGHASIYDVFDQNVNQQYPIRVVYEQQRCTKTDYLLNAKLGINKFAASSDMVPLTEYIPEENTVVLRNGKKIKYDYLVVATGLKQNMGLLKNFEKAWASLEDPVFAPKDYLSWSVFTHKYPRFVYNFIGGDAFICIPPFPYAGEVETYNFFLASEIWKWYERHGKLSPIHSVTIFNANQKFCHFNDAADKFIKDELKRRGIKVEYGLNLVEINQEANKATFESVATKQTFTKEFTNLYSLIPCEKDQSLIKSGLATEESNFLLDVDQNTLQHKKYKNVFGLGDVCNLPTTRSFWAGLYQIQVVRHNLCKAMHGESLNAKYEGYTKVPLILGQNSMTYVEHYYNQRPTRMHLLDKNGGIISKIRYYYYGKMQKKKFLGLYLFKSWGPPYYKFKQQFDPLSVRLNKKFQGILSKFGKKDSHEHDTHGKDQGHANKTKAAASLHPH